MGSVWIALDERLGRRVAVKLLHEHLADDPAFVERFRREARHAAAIDHPNVVRVLDSGMDAGRPFLVMELVDGESLRDALAQVGLRLSIKPVGRISSEPAGTRFTSIDRG